MRQRKVKNLEEKIAALGEYKVAAPETLRGKWSEFFGNAHPIYLEIGCGKGQFAARQAELHPDRNYVAVEGQVSVAVRAMEKAEALSQKSGKKNLVIVCKFVNDLGEMFAGGELSGIYLNFSDPWPKDRHRKRRLTYRERLKSYMQALAPGGFIEIKTDNEALFAFTLAEISECGYTPAAFSYDLHKAISDEKKESGSKESGRAEEVRRNIEKQSCDANSLEALIDEAAVVTTEYEDKFKAMGLAIKYVRIEKEKS